MFSQFGLSGHEFFGYLDQLEVLLVTVIVLVVSILDVLFFIFKIRRLFGGDPVLAGCGVLTVIVRVIGAFTFILGYLGNRRLFLHHLFHYSV